MSAVLTTSLFENLTRGEAFDYRLTLTDLDVLGAVIGLTDVAGSAFSAELLSGGTDIVTGTSEWVKSIGSGMVLSSPTTLGYVLTQIRDADYTGTSGPLVAGERYFLQIWFDRADDDTNRIVLAEGNFRFRERSVTSI